MILREPDGKSMSENSEALGLSDAARKLEAELSRFEQLLLDLERPLCSDDELQQAREVLESCADCEQRLATHLRAFAAVMQSVQARHQRSMESLNQRSDAIRARHLERSALVERIALLGQRAREVSEPIASISEAAWADCTPELMASVHEVTQRLDAVISEAALVASGARDARWTDIATDADALAQQLQGVRNRVVAGQRKLASQAPS
jgi:hypothetical protein